MITAEKSSGTSDSSPASRPVVCAGSPHEMGVAQGMALRQKIHGAYEALERLEAFRLQQPRWVPYWAFRRAAEQKAAQSVAEPLARDYPEMHERLEGIAAGSGLRLEALLLINALEPMLSSVSEQVVVPGSAACSTVAVAPSESATGEPIIHKNFDYLPIVQPFFSMRDSRPARGLRSLDFTVTPLAGAVDGMNEHGLCITNNYAFTTDQATPTGTISMTISEALRRCSTVAEAADWIGSRPRWGGGLLMLADAAGDIASLELSSTRSRLRRAAAGEKFLFHTNKFSCADMREIEVDRAAVFSDRAPCALRGRRVLESPEVRDGRLAELLGRSASLGPDELATLMADHGPDGVPGEYTLCVHSDYWNTTACLQFFPQSRRIRVDFARACQARYAELAL